MICSWECHKSTVHRGILRSKWTGKDVCGIGRHLIWGEVPTFHCGTAKNQPVCESKTGILLIRETNPMKLVSIIKKFVKMRNVQILFSPYCYMYCHWHVPHIISLLNLCLVLHCRHFTAKCVNLSLNWDVRH